VIVRLRESRRTVPASTVATTPEPKSIVPFVGSFGSITTETTCAV